MTPKLEPVDSTCTTIEEQKKYALLPPGTKGYLQEKVEYALMTPRIVTRKLSDGSTVDALLKQAVVSIAIRYEECKVDFRWKYKAEVSFDMWPTFKSAGEDAPIPFLSTTNKSDGPDRRHSLNPFPPGFKAGYLRRPDVIIVSNSGMRWPGRGNVDHDGAPHVDNLLRLVEIKFPGDGWGEGQEDDYVRIAGGAQRMSVLDVSDCDGHLERIKQALRQRVPVATPASRSGRVRAPLRSTEFIPGPVWYERWLSEAEHYGESVRHEIAALWDTAQEGARELSEDAQAWLRQEAAWLFQKGQWLYNRTEAAMVWVSEKGETLYRYTIAQLRAGWLEIERVTDLTWETMKNVQWGQLMLSVVEGVVIMAGVVLVVVVAGAVAAALEGVAIPVVLSAALLRILIGIIAMIAEDGAAAWAALGALLRVSESPALLTP